MRKSLSDDFAQTPIIFIGRVVAKNNPSTSSGGVQLTMEVEEAFKGTSPGSRIVVQTREHVVACGLGMIPVGARWQMWLSENGSTSSCTRSTSNIDTDRVELRRLAIVNPTSASK
ncbi:unnamed protein product [Rotaria sordida]|uniref:Uncharacterized protein n=1 Tax=Rotaria sordida TaxID=392033 RepID=A0A814L2B2_9BILA|nr:unnamed protein product [Rotaria sordida]CAF1059997.1 unnamed protein product [Rotaria sordida]CAF1266382.1 unnamed protein product [Rotaria sordida]